VKVSKQRRGKVIQTTKEMLQFQFDCTRRQAVQLQKEGTEYASTEKLAEKVAQIKQKFPFGKTLKKAEKN